MQNLLETLNNIAPLLIIGSLAIFMTVEKYLPYFEHGMGRGRQRWHNVGMIAIAFVVNAVVGGLIALPVVWSEANNFGLLHRLLGQGPLAIILGIFLIDLTNYALHVTMHKVPALWRIHRVHHADTEMDASSSLRLHPFELLLQMGVQALFLPLMGVSMASFIFYFVLALPWFVLNHSNMKFPAWFERWGSLLMSTPDWHRVHHSSYQPETDSHYGCVFSVWDRLFGTTSKLAVVERIQFGLNNFREPGEQTVWKLLKMPFRK
ncbi:MAG: sterol desaturase family protein [Bacteroidetes bacterium]|nr:sterol desaturase family protein [Bacteroidota bacterium]